MLRIAVTGGIGSGKSTVCRLLARCGAAVYDSDSAAKRLMAEDETLRRRLIETFGEESFAGGELNRAYLASEVFADAGKLAALNALVHPAVRNDFETWCSRQDAEYVVLESAILYESGFDGCVDRVVAVVAPEELRVMRTVERDATTAEAVRRRIAAQMSDDELAARADWTLVNMDPDDLAADVKECDRRFRIEARSHEH